MKLILATAPASEPVSLTDMKKHLRVTHSDDDVLIGSLITGAREQAEKITNRQLMPATYELYFDSVCAKIKLPKPPLVSVVSFQCFDGTSWGDVTDYELDDKAEPAVIYASSWPTVSAEGKNNIKIVFQAGYADAASVPESIKSWLRIEVGKIYDEEKPRIDVGGLLSPYRVVPV